MAKNQDAQNEKYNVAIEGGSSIAGAILGGAAGAIGGPAGIVAGAIVGTVCEHLFSKIGNDIKERILSKSEDRKIETVFSRAAKRISEKLEAGKTIRQDDFFSESIDGRSPAEEILEKTLFVAQREAEERKLPYLANLYANIVFDTSITREQANQLIKAAEEISYEQLVIISVIAFYQIARQQFGTINPKEQDFRQTAYKEVRGYDNIAILTSTYDLIRRGIIFAHQIPIDVASINPSSLYIAGLGANLLNFMELSSIPYDQLTEKIRKTFTYQG